MAMERKEKQLYGIYQSKNVHILSSVLRNINYSTAASADRYFKSLKPAECVSSLRWGKVFCSLKI